MTIRSTLLGLWQHEDINFLLTNRIPRRMATRAMGWISSIESPLLCKLAIPLWRAWGGLDLSESRTQSFRSLHECFVRELLPGVRPIASQADVMVSPCDGIVGAFGRIELGTVLQAKGMPYPLSSLLGSASEAQHYEGGWYLTIRITSAMYHRFHAPASGRIDRVVYHSGDTYNVNPIALKRVEQLFCRNERAAIRMHTEAGEITMVPVAAILVASIRLHFADVLLHLRYRGAHWIDCNATVGRGEELGWFQHGSTIVVLTPRHVAPRGGLQQGERIKMGEVLWEYLPTTNARESTGSGL
jgi:phosphatidylserine decarboxylase